MKLYDARHPHGIDLGPGRTTGDGAIAAVIGTTGNMQPIVSGQSYARAEREHDQLGRWKMPARQPALHPWGATYYIERRKRKERTHGS